MCGLTNQENRARLQKYLRGKALDSVRPLLTIPDNVPKVLDTLKMLFGRPQQVIRRMIEKLDELPTPTESIPDTLIQFANAISNLVSTMKSLHYTGHITNPTLLEDLVARLPHSLQFQWCEVLKTNDKNLGDFANWLMDIATTACLMPTHSLTDEDKSDTCSVPGSIDHHYAVLTTSKLQTELHGRCRRCTSSQHDVDTCPAFGADNVEKRWDIVTRKKLFFLSSSRASNAFLQKEKSL